MYELRVESFDELLLLKIYTRTSMRVAIKYENTIIKKNDENI